MEIVKLKSRQQLFGLRGLTEKFAESVNKTLDWKHCQSVVGSLTECGMAEGYAIVHDKEYLGMLIWSYFPCIVSQELSASEIVFYVDSSIKGGGLKLIRKMIETCKDKKVVNINMTHFAGADRVGKFYVALGFEKTELAYTLKLSKEG